MNKSLSWKILIPFGVLWLLIFHDSALALIGTIILIVGIITGIVVLSKHLSKDKSIK